MDNPLPKRAILQLSKELSDLRPIAEQAEQVQSMTANLVSAQALLAEADGDADIIAMAIEKISKHCYHDEHVQCSYNQRNTLHIQCIVTGTQRYQP